MKLRLSKYIAVIAVIICIVLAILQVSAVQDAAKAKSLYLNVMKLSLLDQFYEKDPKALQATLGGASWPSRAMTMIGLNRLDNIQELGRDVISRNIPGDFIETGAWRGGATIFMRAILLAHGVRDRVVWVADSFEGLPRPNPELYPADAGSKFHEYDQLAVSIEEVKDNFRRYGLLDDQVRFLKGWFKDTLPVAPIEKLSILRLDGDLYESTMDALVHLYPKLSVGGYIIVDDYGAIDNCRRAIHDYRDKHQISDPIIKIDWTGIYWMKTK